MRKGSKPILDIFHNVARVFGKADLPSILKC
jgi:hypothetical protein